jgi:alpha-L-fucosidase
MRVIIIINLFLIFLTSCYTQNLRGGGEAYPEWLTDQKLIEEWKDLKFGMFIHWGPVSLRGTEIGWSRGREIPFNEYDNLYKEFNPVLFNAREWVNIAKQAGMKYLILVTKHHDGFSLWNSKFTNYQIFSSPYKHDIVMELSQECKKQGILFGTYYSILDWYNPHYPIKFRQGEKIIWKENTNMEIYKDFLKNQVKELVDKYQTRILWFDGEWEDPWTHEMGMDLYRFGRELNPSILINNRVDKGRQGMNGISISAKFAGDFETPEQRVGRFNLETPWESCITICKQWAWKPNDSLKSFEECIHTLVRTAGGGGNLLLNIGPMLDGRIEQRQANRLKEMGDWLSSYGESIYETRGGPLAPQPWGVTTQKDNKIFIHVLAPPDQGILSCDLKLKIKSIKFLNTRKEIEFESDGNRIKFQIPKPDFKEIDLIFVLETQA